MKSTGDIRAGLAKWHADLLVILADRRSRGLGAEPKTWNLQDQADLLRDAAKVLDGILRDANEGATMQQTGGLKAQVDVVVACPRCRTAPNLDQWNERKRSGAAVFGCGMCGGVFNMTDWIRPDGQLRPRD